MPPTETTNPLARCKALALAAMIDAGGKPCWVAAHAPEGSPAARPASPPPPPRRHVAAAYQPRLSPPPPPPPPRPLNPAIGCLTPAERDRLAFMSSTAIAALSRLVEHLPDDSPPRPRRAPAPGAHSQLARR
jgi:hypothetical protein